MLISTKWLGQSIEQYFKNTTSPSPQEKEQLTLICNTLLQTIFITREAGVPLLETLRSTLAMFPPEYYTANLQNSLNTLLSACTTIPKLDYIYIIETLCELPSALPFLGTHMHYLLSFYQSLFTTYATAFTTHQGIGNFNGTLRETEQLLKTFLVTQNRLTQPFYAIVQHIVQNDQTNPDKNIIASIIHSVHGILTSSYASKECSFSAGISFAHLLLAILSARSPTVSHTIASQILNYAFPQFSVPTHPEIASSVDWLPDLHLDTCMALPKILLYRGILITATTDILLSPITLHASQRYNWFPRSSLLVFREGTLLLDVMLPSFLGLCEKATTRYVRMIALQSLQEWLKRLVTIVKKTEYSSDQYNTIRTHLSRTQFFDETLNYVWKNWDDHFEPIIDQVLTFLYCIYSPRPNSFLRLLWSSLMYVSRISPPKTTQ